MTAAACGVEVHKDGDGKTATVNVASPFGSINVKTDIDASKTGLPVYPGGRPPRMATDVNRADVNISGGKLFGVKVVALEMESDEAVQPIQTGTLTGRTARAAARFVSVALSRRCP